MIKITAKLQILDTWLTGGQIDGSGNNCEGFTGFNYEVCPTLKATIEEIIFSIETGEEIGEIFEYYGTKYKFKCPSEKNLNILAKRIFKRIQNEKTNDWLETLNDEGMVEIQGGVYLYTQKNAIADQASWPDTDEGKELDFTIYKYWVMTDNGVDPEGFDTLKEVLELIED
jgi:hypothetical protein